jgi:hypothetical protein
MHKLISQQSLWQRKSVLKLGPQNNLSFIETSALDSTNVETAFHNILTGSVTLLSFLGFRAFLTFAFHTDRKLQWVEINPSNICIFPTDIRFIAAWCYYANGFYGCCQMSDGLVSSHPENCCRFIEHKEKKQLPVNAIRGRGAPLHSA